MVSSASSAKVCASGSNRNRTKAGILSIVKRPLLRRRDLGNRVRGPQPRPNHDHSLQPVAVEKFSANAPEESGLCPD